MMHRLLHAGKCKYYLQQVDPDIKTARMTDKVAKGIWYKTLGGLSAVWQVRYAVPNRGTSFRVFLV
jgi:hypothetical protein